MADFLTAAASTLETASVAPRDSDSPIAASALCVFSVSVVEGLDAAAALLAAAASAFATFETRIASPAAVSTLFTVFVMAFRPGYRALADAADAPPLAAALAPDLPVSEVDTDPGLDPDAADSCRTRAVAVGAGLTFGERIVLSSSEAG